MKKLYIMALITMLFLENSMLSSSLEKELAARKSERIAKQQERAQEEQVRHEKNLEHTYSSNKNKFLQDNRTKEFGAIEKELSMPYYQKVVLYGQAILAQIKPYFQRAEERTSTDFNASLKMYNMEKLKSVVDATQSVFNKDHNSKQLSPEHCKAYNILEEALKKYGAHESTYEGLYQDGSGKIREIRVREIIDPKTSDFLMGMEEYTLDPGIVFHNIESFIQRLEQEELQGRWLYKLWKQSTDQKL